MDEVLPKTVAPGTLRIFLVENHRDTLKYMKMYLESLGHTVQTASTMNAALAALPSADCNMLITDIGLPDGDGWELLRRAREIVPHPYYAVSMSGYALTPSQQVNYRHHFLKPFNVDELEVILAEAAREMNAPQPG